jgi:hypothetical protein
MPRKIIQLAELPTPLPQDKELERLVSNGFNSKAVLTVKSGDVYFGIRFSRPAVIITPRHTIEVDVQRN